MSNQAHESAQREPPAGWARAQGVAAHNSCPLWPLSAKKNRGAADTRQVCNRIPRRATFRLDVSHEHRSAPVPSLAHTSRPTILSLPATKNRVPSTSVSSVGLELLLGLMSSTSAVPAVVPSLLHSSQPKIPSLARKKSVPFTLVGDILRLSHGEYAGEEICENSQGHQPQADDHENEPTPPLHRRSARPDALGYSFLGEGDEEGRAEGEQHDCRPRDNVGDKSRPESSGC